MPILALLTVLALSGAAWAQGGLGQDIVTASPLSPAQRARVDEYVKGFLPDLISDDPAACQRARQRLTEPLEDRNISLDFRRQYSQMLMGSVQVGARSPNDQIAVNSLLLAGRLATTEAVEVLERALSDERVPVRYAGVAGLTIVVAQIQASAPAVFDQRMQEVVTRVGRVVREDSSPIVMDAGVRMLVAAATQDRFPSVRASALNEVADAVLDRLRSEGGNPGLQIYIGALRAGDALRSVLIADVSNRETIVAGNSVELSGHVLAFLAERIEAGSFDGWETDVEIARRRNAAIQMLQLSEATINLVNTDYHAGQQLPSWGLSDTFESGDAEAAARTIREDVVGPDGALTAPPFSFPDDTFIR